MGMLLRSPYPEVTNELPVTDGLALHLDASDLSTLFQDSALSIPATSTNDPIGGWSDKSGNARHMTQADSAEKPALQLAALNGLSVVRFDGSDDHLQATYAGAGNELTLFAVKRRISALEHRGVASFTDGTYNDYNGNAAGFAWGTEGEAATEYRSERGGYGTIATFAHPGNVAHLYASMFEGPTYTQWLNGAGAATGPAGADFAFTLVTIGARMAPGPSYGANADYAEFIVYNRALDSTERADVTAFLTTKWGL